MLRFARRPKARLDSPPRPRGWRRDGAVKPGDISSVTVVLAIAKTLQRHAPTQLKRATQAPPSQGAPVRVRNARSGTGEEREERGKRGGGTPLHAKTTAQIGITEHPRFFGMNISVMEVIQDEPFERFMSYFLMQIPMEGLVVHQFQILRNNKQF